MTTRNARTVVGSLLVTLLVVGFGGPAALGQQTGERQVVSQEQYDAWFDELSNWGRWGPDDEMGALNLITLRHGIVTRGVLYDIPRLKGVR